MKSCMRLVTPEMKSRGWMRKSLSSSGFTPRLDFPRLPYPRQRPFRILVDVQLGGFSLSTVVSASHILHSIAGRKTPGDFKPLVSASSSSLSGGLARNRLRRDKLISADASAEEDTLMQIVETTISESTVALRLTEDKSRP